MILESSSPSSSWHPHCSYLYIPICKPPCSCLSRRRSGRWYRSTWDAENSIFLYRHPTRRTPSGPRPHLWFRRSSGKGLWRPCSCTCVSHCLVHNFCLHRIIGKILVEISLFHWWSCEPASLTKRRGHIFHNTLLHKSSHFHHQHIEVDFVALPPKNSYESFGKKAQGIRRASWCFLWSRAQTRRPRWHMPLKGRIWSFCLFLLRFALNKRRLDLNWLNSCFVGSSAPKKSWTCWAPQFPLYPVDLRFRWRTSSYRVL